MKPYARAIALLASLLALGGCGDSDGPVFQGYVEGEYVYLASSQAGRLETLHAERGARAASGALLFALEAEYERLAVDRAEREALAAASLLQDMETGKRPEEIAVAEAQLAQARADAANAAALLRRHEPLARSGGVSRQEYEDSAAAAKSAAARVTELAGQLAVARLPEREKRVASQRAEAAAAKARAAQARWTLDQKRIHAPADGLVYDTLYRVGEWVPAGSPVVQMLPPGNVVIRFFVPEPLVGGLRVGGRATVRADGRSDFPAVVSYVASNAEYTPPVIFSNETRSKLVFMVEARPEAATAASLHPGQPVSVSLP